MKKIFRRLLSYFFQGLLVVVPTALTIYAITASIKWLDGLIQLPFPGLGLLIIVSAIGLIGIISSNLLSHRILDFLEGLIIKIPLVGIIYSSSKDLIDAFVGDKKKFNQAVLVTENEAAGIQKLGFITQEDLSSMGLPGKIAVYMPHSYAFSGVLIIVPKDKVVPLKAPRADIMKFIVSGGVSGKNIAEETKNK